jgi:hypothetical protein
MEPKKEKTGKKKKEVKKDWKKRDVLLKMQVYA